MKTIILVVAHASGTTGGNIAGAFIALLLLVYLVYALIKPEKF